MSASEVWNDPGIADGERIRYGGRIGDDHAGKGELRVHHYEEDGRGGYLQTVEIGALDPE